jgi:restriction system protein
VTARKKRRRYVGRLRGHPVIAVLAVLVVAAWVSRHLWLIPVVLAVVAAGGGLYLARRRRARRRQLELTRSVAVTNGMTGSQFEQWVAMLMIRDGFTRVRVVGGGNDCGADVTAVAPNGLRTVVQCKRFTSRAVCSPDVQRFAGTARLIHGADIALVVTTSRATGPARKLAVQLNILIIERDGLAAWAAHGRLPGVCV